jgi:hypothetical protein
MRTGALGTSVLMHPDLSLMFWRHQEWTSVAGAHDRTRIPARPDVWLRR